MHKRLGLLGVALLLSACSDGERPTFFSLFPGSGLTLRGPANLPHDGFDGDFWVDTRGCTFIRSDSGQWVPRVDASGRAFCDPNQAYDLPDNIAKKNPNVPEQDLVQVDPRTGVVTTIMAPKTIPRSYVRVADFADVAKGRAVQQDFRALGFPVVGAGDAPAAGKALTVVLGPFTVQSALDDAVSVAKARGYADAKSYAN